MKKYISWIVGIVAVIVIVIIALSGSNKPKELTGVSFATHKIPLAAPYIIAKEKGFFEKNGLDVKVTYFLTGLETLQALTANQVDFASTGATPYVHLSFQRDDVKIIGQVTLADDFQIIARKDAGITTPQDIKGKKIGSVKGTVTMIAIRDTLRKAGLADTDYQFVEFNQPLPLPNLLLTNEVQAYSAWEPHISNGIKALGADKVVIFGANEGLHTLPYFTMMRAGDLEKEEKLELANKFNKAVLEAIEYIKNNREESIKTVAQVTGMEEAQLASIWNKYDFSLSLKKSLLDELNNERFWFKKDDPKVIDYTKLIDTRSLKKVNPKAVEI